MNQNIIISILAVLIVGLVLFAACGDDDDDDNDDAGDDDSDDDDAMDDDDDNSNSVTVIGVLQVSGNFEGGTATNKGKAPGDGLENDFDLVSYTPDSMKITFHGISIYQDDNTAIEIPAPAEAIELIGLDSFATIFESEVEISEDQYGEYSSLHLSLNNNVTLSALFEVNGKTYEYEDIQLELQWGGFDLNLINPVTVDEASEIVIGVVLDLEDILLLWRIDSGGDGVLVDEDTNAYTVFNPPIILPYVGEVTPTMEQYYITFNTDAFGDNSLYYLRMDLLFDEQGDLTVAGWCPVMVEGYNQIVGYEPAMLQAQEITKISDTVWGIKDINDEPAAADRVLEFPAFELADHSGTMNFGENTYEYEAIKIP